MNPQAGEFRPRQVIEILDDEDPAILDHVRSQFEHYDQDQWNDAEFLEDLDNFPPLPIAPKPAAPRYDLAAMDAQPGQFSQSQPAHLRTGREAGGEGPPTKDDCIAGVCRVFPDISTQYVEDLCKKHGNNDGFVIAAICEAEDQGSHYPKMEEPKNLKRKRESTAAEEAQKMYGSSGLEEEIIDGLYIKHTREMLKLEFKSTPMAFIDAILRARPTRHLFHAYKVLEEAERTYKDANPKPYSAIRKARETPFSYSRLNLERTVQDLRKTNHDNEHELKAAEELLAARTVRQEADERRAAEKLAEEEESLNTKIAEEEGTMTECGCCLGDYPLNRMVHCNGENLHWFCRSCASRTAKEVIGNSRYEITCMSMDGCKANFSRDQMLEFLDEKLFIALDRNEQEAVLRLAGIENLASCPYCPYAAEYPPVEEDKEFRCQAPDCKKVSCRLCKLETHIPKSCEEFAGENGLSIRRQIEEAMTAALIRTCNKCSTPFVKEAGCNKMTCTRNGCFNIQCYVCSKSCDYSHFNETSRGGKPGNCPLFEDVESRHEQEVKKAEDEAIQKVRTDHPEYSEDDLRIHVSDNVRKEDDRRRALRQGPNHRLNPNHILLAGIAYPPDGRAEAHAQHRAPLQAQLLAQNQALLHAHMHRGAAAAAAVLAQQPVAPHAIQHAQIDRALQAHMAERMQHARQAVHQAQRQELQARRELQDQLMLRQNLYHEPMPRAPDNLYVQFMPDVFGGPVLQAPAPANLNQQVLGRPMRPEVHPIPQPRQPMPQLRGFPGPARFFEGLRRHSVRAARDQPEVVPAPRPFLPRAGSPHVNAAAGQQPGAIPKAPMVEKPAWPLGGRIRQLAANVANQVVGHQNAAPPMPPAPINPKEQAGRSAPPISPPPRTPSKHMDPRVLPDGGPRQKRRARY